MAFTIIDNLSDLHFSITLLRDYRDSQGNYPSELLMTPAYNVVITNPDPKCGRVSYPQPIRIIKFVNQGVMYHGKADVKPQYVDYLRFLPKFSFNIESPTHLLVTLKLNNSTTITSSFAANDEEPDLFKVPNIESRIANSDWKWFQHNYQQVTCVRTYIEEKIRLGLPHGYETMKGSFIADILNKDKPTRVVGKNGIGYATYTVMKELISDTKLDIKNLGIVIKKERTWFNKQRKTETEYMIVSALGVVMVFEGSNPDFVTPSKLVYIRLV